MKSKYKPTIVIWIDFKIFKVLELLFLIHSYLLTYLHIILLKGLASKFNHLNISSKTRSLSKKWEIFSFSRLVSRDIWFQFVPLSVDYNLGAHLLSSTLHSSSSSSIFWSETHPLNFTQWWTAVGTYMGTG